MAVDIYVQDVWAKGTTSATLERHCAEAVRVGVPVNEVVRALGRLPKDIADSIVASLPDDTTRDEARVVRTMGFVTPCDIPSLALSLLERDSN
jgi:hypothetical protein